MKHLLQILPWLLVIILIGVIFFKPDQAQLNQLELQLQIDKQLSTQRQDSIKSALQQTRDTLEAVYAVMETKRREAEIARLETQKLRKTYENIHFVDFVNDTVRTRELSNLYPSYKNR